MAFEENEYYVITELNTRKNTFQNELDDILYGDPYQVHEFDSVVEARKFEKILNKKGITTNLNKVIKSKQIN